MGIAQLAVIILSVGLSATAQILFKAGMVSAAVRQAIAAGDPAAIFLSVAGSLNILVGLICFGLSLVMWLFVLSRVPLSTAYPFVALGIAVTVVGGAIMFGEVLSIQKVSGVALIMLGIFTVASA